MGYSYQLSWRRFERFGVDSADTQWLRPYGDPLGTYEPAAVEGIPTALAHCTLGAADIESAIRGLCRFMSEYGSLGEATLAYPETGGRKTRDEHGRVYLVPGDRWGWVLEHVANVRAILALAEARRRGVWRRLRRALEQTVQEQERWPRLLRIPTVVPPKFVPVTLGDDLESCSLQFSPADAENIRALRNMSALLRQEGESRVADRLIRARLAPNLTGVRRTADGFQFAALIQLIYWQLADGISARRQLRPCQACGTPFFVTDGRQRFCPPPPNGPSESRCGKFYRMRRLRGLERKPS